MEVIEIKDNISKEEYCKKIIINTKGFKNIEIIGITGSIGRKEKKIDEKELNDVDFFVVANRVDWIKKKQLEKELNVYLGTEYTDICFIKTKDYLKVINKKKISQFYYDMIYGATILYSKNTFSITYKKREVNLISLYIVYITRLWCLIGPYNFLEKKIMCKNKKFAEYQLKKAVSGLIDAILIFENKYESPLNKIKIEHIKLTNYYSENICFKNLIEDYIENKMELTIENYLKIINIYIQFGDKIFKNNNIYFTFFKLNPMYFFRNIKSIKDKHKMYKKLKNILKNNWETLNII